MGRTNPTFRNYLEHFEKEWQPYRRALRAPHQTEFDALLDHAHRFADAAGYQNTTDPDHATLLSILLAHQINHTNLESRIDTLEARLDETE